MENCKRYKSELLKNPQDEMLMWITEKAFALVNHLRITEWTEDEVVNYKDGVILPEKPYNIVDNIIWHHVFHEIHYDDGPCRHYVELAILFRRPIGIMFDESGVSNIEFKEEQWFISTAGFGAMDLISRIRNNQIELRNSAWEFQKRHTTWCVVSPRDPELMHLLKTQGIMYIEYPEPIEGEVSISELKNMKFEELVDHAAAELRDEETSIVGE